jgi:hypothetical protein
MAAGRDRERLGLGEVARGGWRLSVFGFIPWLNVCVLPPATN